MKKATLRGKNPQARERRESGQASIEYTLMLAIVIGIAITLKGQLEPILDDLREGVTASFDRQLFGSFHRVNVGRVGR